MFKTGVRMLSQSYTRSQFVSKPNRRFLYTAIFGGSFFVGYLVSRQISFTDLVAWYRYDKLPQNAPQVIAYKGQLADRFNKLPILSKINRQNFVEVIRKYPSGKDKGNKDAVDSVNYSALNLRDNLNVVGGITLDPHYYYSPDTHETIGIYHVGMKLTGYPFIIHGGILSTLFEDLMSEQVELQQGASSFSKKSYKLKDIELSYRLPTWANQFIIIRSTETKVENGKITIKAEILNEKCTHVLVKGRGTFQ